MITASLLRRRSRMLIALLSIAVGATILSGLVTIYYDVPRQMGAQFRSYGANMILLPDGDEVMTAEKLEAVLETIPDDELVGATPYRYVRLDMPSRQQSFTTAGTDFSQVVKTSPYFSVDGAYPEGRREIMIGREIAETIGAKLGASIELSYKPSVTASGDASEDRKAGTQLIGSAEGFNEAVLSVRVTLDDDEKIESIEVDASSQTEDIGSLVGTDKAFLDQFIGKELPLTLGDDVDAVTGATISSQAVVDALNGARSEENAVAMENPGHFNVTGILSTGGEEESYIYMSLEDLQKLTGDETLDVAELSVTAAADELEGYSEAINQSGDGIKSRLVKRVAKSEARGFRSRKASGTGIPGDCSRPAAYHDLRIYDDDGGCIGKKEGDRPSESARCFRQLHPEGISGRRHVPRRPGRAARRDTGICVRTGRQRECIRLIHQVPAAAASCYHHCFNGNRCCFMPAAHQTRGRN